MGHRIILSPAGVYARLYRAFGPQEWWPGDTRFEVIIGAILTQNTAWANVEKAIANLKEAGALVSPEKMRRFGARRLSGLIKPAGYYNIKAARIMNFLDFLSRRYNSSLRKLSCRQTAMLGHELLGVNGIGPETRDSILLYAFDRPVFVVDAYTKRIFSRHGFCRPDDSYDEVQGYFMSTLRNDVKYYNEYHALIVRLGKEMCRTKPFCEKCPLRGAKITCK